ncbi:MAG: tRNA guanosine(34) transglycosylase Tgt [Bacteroidota bacterium]
MRFSVIRTDGEARAGILSTTRGDVPTPAFMPVGTQGTVKTLGPRELREAGARLILCNTYHLYLRPGTPVIERAGGLHRFIRWEGPLLTDSGGYQVFSLPGLRRVEEEGVSFRSHHDGSLHGFTPEKVVDIQRGLGSDVMMVLDECPPYPSAREVVHASVGLTLRWAERSLGRRNRTRPLHGREQALFGIVQGGVFPDLRRSCARELRSLGFDGYAIGGLSVGEPAPLMYRMVEEATGELPSGLPRYLMGVGTPANILECIGRGVDLFDCVLPTRNGRNGMLFTRNGTLNLRNARFSMDLAPPDEACSCYTCRHFSRAYLRHLFRAGEVLGLQLATLHNLSYYELLVSGARQAILAGCFPAWKAARLADLMQPDRARDTPSIKTKIGGQNEWCSTT